MGTLFDEVKDPIDVIKRKEIIETLEAATDKAEDVAKLDLDEVKHLLDELNLPPHLHSLWSHFLEYRHAAR